MLKEMSLFLHSQPQSFVDNISQVWQQRGSGNWNPFTHLSVCLGMEAKKTIPLLNRSVQTKKAEKILLLWMSMKAMENNSDFFSSILSTAEV